MHRIFALLEPTVPAIWKPVVSGVFPLYSRAVPEVRTRLRFHSWPHRLYCTVTKKYCTILYLYPHDISISRSGTHCLVWHSRIIKYGNIRYRTIASTEIAKIYIRNRIELFRVSLLVSRVSNTLCISVIRYYMFQGHMQRQTHRHRHIDSRDRGRDRDMGQRQSQRQRQRQRSIRPCKYMYDNDNDNDKDLQR